MKNQADKSPVSGKPPVSTQSPASTKQPVLARSSVPTKQPAPAKKPIGLLVGLSIGGAVLVLLFFIAGIASVVGSRGFSFGELGNFISSVNKGIKASSDYPDRVAAYEAVNKTFTVGQTMQYGPLDIKAKVISQNFKPSPEELAYIDKIYAKESQKSRQEYYLDDNTAQYVQARFTVQYVAARDGQDNITFDDFDPFLSRLNMAKLNNTYPLVYWIKDVAQPRTLLSDNAIETIKEGDPIEFVYLFKVPAATEGKLTLNVSAYTSVSPIVGTEGMPRKQFTYSLALWP